MDYERLALKDQAIQLRIVTFGKCLCDLCRSELGGEYHEWCRRAYTVGDDTARRLSFNPCICSLLCRKCHEKEAITQEGLRRLMAFNVALYGAQEVYDALHAIPERLWMNRIPDVIVK